MRIIKTTQALSMPGRLPTAFTIFNRIPSEIRFFNRVNTKRWCLHTGEPQQQFFLYAATPLVDFNVSACPEVLSLKKPPRNEEQLVLS
jgi:hypothetical protein